MALCTFLARVLSLCGIPEDRETPVFDAIIQESPLHANLSMPHAAIILVWSRRLIQIAEVSLDDVLNERHSGKCLPVFRGDYVRRKLYIDLQTRKSCWIVSCINYARDGRFWVTNKALRIYHQGQAGSVSKGWTSPAKTIETVYCYRALLETFGGLYPQCVPRIYRPKLLRLAVYLKLAGFPEDAWKNYRRAASMTVWRETIGAAVMLLLGAHAAGLDCQYIEETRIG